VDPKDLLSDIGSRVKSAFVENRRILSFDEYLSLVAKDPTRHARSSAQYVRDMFDHYGTETVRAYDTEQTRYKLFDAPFDGGRERVAGQEMVQQDIYRILHNFERERSVSRLIFLHGPNGSAKSSIIACILRGLAAYSQTDGGALYRFNWIFPSARTTKGALGFGGEGDLSSVRSFAHLRDDQIDARTRSELKDHPLFLLPVAERTRFLDTALERVGRAGDFTVPDYVRHGDLDHKSKQIFEALLAAYQGDYVRVLRHVQIERFYLSRRYREGLVTVEPQMSVDASLRQITMDRSVGSLPSSLSMVTMFEPSGDLVDANRGVLEFNDILKRPIEAFKYLLATCEKSSVSVDGRILYLDQVFIATANEKQLDAFKSIPDFQSFKARIELVKAPYILRASVEQEIYDDFLTRESVGKHVTPHTTLVVSRWAVMTRLMKPMADKYPASLREIVAKLTPREKLRLYDAGELPDGLAAQPARELRAHIAEIWRESRNYPNYEGRQGASPREIKTLLLNAAQNRRYECVSPLAAFDELEELCKQRGVYEFLQQEVVDGFHDHPRFIEDVRQQYLDLLDDEVRAATGLVEERLYDDLLDKYVLQISHWVKKEKIENKVTRTYEDPDEDFMGEIESVLSKPGETKANFRQGVINQIAAWKIEHPTESVNVHSLFPKYLVRLRDAYYERNKRVVQRRAEALLRHLSGEDSSLDEEDLRGAKRMLERLLERGYCPACAREIIAFLLKRRYA
jgi:predicted Ser/Thr protein kinase